MNQTTGRISLRLTLMALFFAALLGVSLSNPADADKESISDSHQTRRIAALERQLGQMKHNTQHRRIKTRQAIRTRVNSQVNALRRQVYGELNYRTDVLVCMIDTLEAEVRSVPLVPCAEQTSP